MVARCGKVRRPSQQKIKLGRLLPTETNRPYWPLRGPIGMPRGPRVGPGGPNLDFVGGGKWGKVGPQGQRDPPRGARRRVSATAANLVHGTPDMSASRPETIFKVVRGPNPGGGILGLVWKIRGPISGGSPYSKYPTPRARDPHIQVRRPMLYRNS